MISDGTSLVNTVTGAVCFGRAVGLWTSRQDTAHLSGHGQAEELSDESLGYTEVISRTVRSLATFRHSGLAVGRQGQEYKSAARLWNFPFCDTRS